VLTAVPKVVSAIHALPKAELNAALSPHQSGHLIEAEAVYRRVLARDPGNPFSTAPP
jgi:hypothetical protein